MKRTIRQLTLVLSIVALLAAPTLAVTIRSRDVEVTVRPDGCGLIDEVKYKGEVVMSSIATGHTPTPGFTVDAKRIAAAARFTAKAAALRVNAPCKLTESKSARGHKLYTLENGLLKVTAMTWFGGRIIRLEPKLTGVNVLDNPYEDRPDEVEGPKTMSGLWGEIYDGVFHAKVQKKTDDEVVLLLTGEGKDVRIEKTLRLRRGRSAVEITQKQINTGEDTRETTNNLFGRFRLGETTGPEDVLWGSSRGRATRFWRKHRSPDCHTDPRVDGWAALCETRDGLTLVGVHRGPVIRIGTWVRPAFYQFECWTPRHFKVDAGKAMTTTWTLAPVFNMGGVAYADETMAVGIVPDSDVVPAEAKTWTTSVAAVTFSKPGRNVTLKAHIIDRHGKRVKDLPPVTTPASFLVAQPRRVNWPVDGLHAGAYDMHIDIESGGKKLGKTMLKLHRADAGVVFETFRPTDAEKGKALAVLGTVARGKVKLASVVATSPRSIRVTGKHVLADSSSPFNAEIRLNADGDGFDVKHTLTVNEVDARIRAVGLALPLALGNDYNKVRTTVGGEKLNDAWRVDQTDEVVYTMTVSDYLSRWPLWKLGGVLQDTPGHYRIWKASDWDTAPMPTLQGAAAPGWVEMTSGKWGVRISLPDMTTRAPRGIVVDGYTGTARVWFYPPQASPIALASSLDAAAPSLADRLKWQCGVPWTNTVSVRFHAGPHLRGFKREVSDAAFRAVLDALGETTVVRTMSVLCLPGRTYDKAAASIIASDLTLRDFLKRAVGGRRLRTVCLKLGCPYLRNDEAKTIDGVVEYLKDKYP